MHESKNSVRIKIRGTFIASRAWTLGLDRNMATMVHREHRKDQVRDACKKPSETEQSWHEVLI